MSGEYDQLVAQSGFGFPLGNNTSNVGTPGAIPGQTPVNSIWGNSQVLGGALAPVGGDIPIPKTGGDVPTGLFDRAANGDFGTLQGWGTLAGGLGDIGKAYMAYKNYGLGKDQLEFNKQLTNRNLANQAIITNAKMKAWGKVRGMNIAPVDGSKIA